MEEPEPVAPIVEEAVKKAAVAWIGVGGADELVKRWTSTGALLRLSPGGPVRDLPDDSQAAAPRPTSATRLPKRPFRLHRVRRH